MAYNRRKRKVKKNIPEAQAHISTSYNNTLVTITDVNGNTISWASSGTIGYKGSKKKTPYAAGLAAESAGKAAMEARAIEKAQEAVNNAAQAYTDACDKYGEGSTKAKADCFANSLSPLKYKILLFSVI